VAVSGHPFLLDWQLAIVNEKERRAATAGRPYKQIVPKLNRYIFLAI